MMVILFSMWGCLDSGPGLCQLVFQQQNAEFTPKSLRLVRVFLVDRNSDKLKTKEFVVRTQVAHGMKDAVREPGSERARIREDPEIQERRGT